MNVATTHRHGYGIIVVSLAFALLLAVIPLPDAVVLARPEFVTLFLIYWCIALPERVGVGTAWLLGLVLDVLLGALFGQHALALTIVAFLATRLHLRIRVYPLWQQALSILVLVTIYQLVMLWTSGIIGKPATSWTYWLPSLASMLTWPVLFIMLNGVQRGFDVS